MRAIILAGGKGTRLRPYTVAIPKPLVPLGDEKPILEVVIEQLKKNGFTHITIALNHLAEIIMAYAGNGSRWGVDIDYSRETDSLGTIGPLTLINDLPEHFLVMNGDVLSDLDYGQFLRDHIAQGSEVSVAAKRREVKVDFGVISFDPKTKHLTDFKEKPAQVAHFSMGVNCFSKHVIDSLPKGQKLGFDDLMIASLSDKTQVRVHEHEGFWLDIGRPEDYQYAVDNFEDIKKML